MSLAPPVHPSPIFLTDTETLQDVAHSGKVMPWRERKQDRLKKEYKISVCLFVCLRVEFLFFYFFIFLI